MVLATLSGRSVPVRSGQARTDVGIVDSPIFGNGVASPSIDAIRGAMVALGTAVAMRARLAVLPPRPQDDKTTRTADNNTAHRKRALPWDASFLIR